LILVSARLRTSRCSYKRRKHVIIKSHLSAVSTTNIFIKINLIQATALNVSVIIIILTMIDETYRLKLPFNYLIIVIIRKMSSVRSEITPCSKVASPPIPQPTLTLTLTLHIILHQYAGIIVECRPGCPATHI
jgi:hypothetical protein